MVAEDKGRWLEGCEATASGRWQGAAIRFAIRRRNAAATEPEGDGWDGWGGADSRDILQAMKALGSVSIRHMVSWHLSGDGDKSSNRNSSHDRDSFHDRNSSGKTSATPACLSCTCEPHRCGGCPQFGYTGTGYLPPMQIQAVSLWPMFCRKAAVWSSGGKKELLPSRFQHQTFKCDTKPCRGHPIIYIFIQFIFQPIAMVIMIK